MQELTEKKGKLLMLIIPQKWYMTCVNAELCESCNSKIKTMRNDTQYKEQTGG